MEQKTTKDKLMTYPKALEFMTVLSQEADEQARSAAEKLATDFSDAIETVIKQAEEKGFHFPTITYDNKEYSLADFFHYTVNAAVCGHASRYMVKAVEHTATENAWMAIEALLKGAVPKLTPPPTTEEPFSTNMPVTTEMPLMPDVDELTLYMDTVYKQKPATTEAQAAPSPETTAPVEVKPKGKGKNNQNKSKEGADGLFADKTQEEETGDEGNE